MTPDKIIKKESEKITDATNKFINALKKQGIAMNKISWDMTSRAARRKAERDRKKG